MDVAESLVAQFDKMVQRDGGSLQLLGTRDNVIRVGYKLGGDPTCEDGACVLPEAELQELMSETLARRDHTMRVEVSRL